MAASSPEDTLIEERDVEMVSPSGGISSRRVAHFLKPSLPSLQNSPQNSQTLFKPTNPNTPNLKSFFSNINLIGWRHPQSKWSSWIEKLRPTFEPIWKKASIFEPIMASALEIPKCYDTMFAFTQRWCPETNSFMLPWGEVTITLEDILVLGGFSVTGHSVLSENSSKELLEIEEKLFKEYMNIARSKHKKSSQAPWMDFWMESGSEFEHEAFLSLWLSRSIVSRNAQYFHSRSRRPKAYQVEINGFICQHKESWNQLVLNSFKGSKQ